MSWLNLNQSLNSIKGQITNFASEVLSEGIVPENSDETPDLSSSLKELEEKCRNQDLQISALKKLTEELQASLQAERLSKKNGIKEEDSNWYWDPPPQTSKLDPNIESQYQSQIRALQDEISSLKRDAVDLRPDNEEELHRLREENRNLTNNLDDLDNQHQLAMEKLLTLKKELQKNFEVLKHEHEDLKSANDEYAAEVKTLLSTLSERDKEIESLKTAKSDYDTLHHKYQNLERIHSLLRENAEKFQEENQDLHEEVFKLQEQVTKLEHEIEIATKHSELSNVVPRENYDEILKELNDIKQRRNTNSLNSDEINIDDNAKSVIENLKREINDLRHKLSQNECVDQESDNKSVKIDKIMQMYKKYVDFELPVDYVGEIPSTGYNTAAFKLESVFKTLNLFKKDIDLLQHKLSEKNLNINHLNTQIEDLTAENDFLTTDIQHFERELNEMKKNNDFLISEIAALKNTSKLEPIIETHEDNLAKLETELADCNRINKSFESEIKRIEAELTDVKNEKNNLQESLKDLKEKYTSMLNELEMCKNHTKTIEAIENSTKLEDTDKLNKLLHNVDNLKGRLNSANVKNEQLSIDLHIVENDKVLLTQQVDELKQIVDERNSTYKEWDALKTTLEHKLQDVESKMNEVLNNKLEIENENSKLQEKVAILEKQISDQTSANISSADLNRVTTEKLQLAEKLEQTMNENSTLKEALEKMTSEISELRRHNETFLFENSSLRNDYETEVENSSALRKQITELKEKVRSMEAVCNEIKILKEDNQILAERKLQLELDLGKKDHKIIQFQEDFEKLKEALNEKDAIIETLNTTVKQNNISISKLKEEISDIDLMTDAKNKEISRLGNLLMETTESIKSTHSPDDFDKLSREKEDINKHILQLHNDVLTKSDEITTLKNRLDELQKNSIENEAVIEIKNKEINALHENIKKLTEKLDLKENSTCENDATLIKEKEMMAKEILSLRSDLTLKENEIVKLKENLEHFEKTCREYQTLMEKSNVEKTELINLVNLKHNESIQYHNEIQRLNHVLFEQTNEYKKIIEDKEKFSKSTENCSNCETLKVTLNEKDETIMRLNENITDYQKVKAELLRTNETLKDLTEKCDNLDRNLAIQLETVKRLTAENAQLSELEQNSARELERLRHHLVETEENYTQELMTSEQKLTECQTRLHQVEERAKQTSTVYTSNSIRANQEVETLRNQIKLMEKQRDDVQARLSEAEDARSRSEAALTNLQVVLEQFQLDKERDIQAATEKLRNKIEDFKHENNDLRAEISRLNVKLEEALAGLQAASRLGDQVETKTAQINDLREQVRVLQTSVSAAEERYYNSISNQQDKVDKNLVKNLLINYVVTANNSLNKTQVLRILSSVLDFNQQECEKLGLVRSTNVPDSLAMEFVKFLQNESKPRAALPNMINLVGTTSPHSTSRQPTPVETGHKRNPSTGSNNLLFQNLDSVETSSQISVESDSNRRPDTRAVTVGHLDTGVNQTRNTEGAILKHVLKDM